MKYKFRVWNPVLEKFVFAELSPRQINWSSPEYTRQNLLRDVDDNISGVIMYDVENWEMSTGLTDSKGVEIFEGDIVKNSVMEYEVIFKNGAFRGKALDCEYRDDFNHTELYSIKGLEIIGNKWDSK